MFQRQVKGVDASQLNRLRSQNAMPPTATKRMPGEFRNRLRNTWQNFQGRWKATPRRDSYNDQLIPGARAEHANINTMATMGRMPNSRMAQPVAPTRPMGGPRAQSMPNISNTPRVDVGQRAQSMPNINLRAPARSSSIADGLAKPGVMAKVKGTLNPKNNPKFWGNAYMLGAVGIPAITGIADQFMENNNLNTQMEIQAVQNKTQRDIDRTKLLAEYGGDVNGDGVVDNQWNDDGDGILEPGEGGTEVGSRAQDRRADRQLERTMDQMNMQAYLMRMEQRRARRADASFMQSYDEDVNENYDPDFDYITGKRK